ncbi:MAG: sugar ABC transporter permease [Dermatophilaceae bacterium]
MTTLVEGAATSRSRSGGRPKVELSDRAKAERKLGWKLAGPAFAVMLAVTAYPILNAVWLSLFDYRLTDPSARKFTFLNNYAVVLTDGLWWGAVLTTVIITMITVVVELILGMALAMIMNKVVWPRRTLRTVVLIPYAIITVVSAFAWRFAFAVDTGFMNHWLHTLTFGAFSESYDWFGGHWSAIIAICVSEIWKTTPFMSLLLLAGLANVDSSLEEAAEVDGATFWQRLFKVIVPNMKGAIMVALLFRTLDAFRIFDAVFVMTGGAQDTSTVSLVAYNQTISRVEVGMGSAVSVLLFLIVVAISFVFIKGFKVDLSQVRGE